jgi:hypothetical protein
MIIARDRNDQRQAESARRQTRRMSLVEATTNVVVGYMLAFAIQLAVFPLFGLAVSVPDNMLISGIFTAVSLARSYALRRLFEWLHMRNSAAPSLESV